jgi:hypothetical protein
MHLPKYERIYATAVRQSWRTCRTQGSSTPQIRRCSITPIQTKTCTNQLRRPSSKKTKVKNKSVVNLWDYMSVSFGLYQPVPTIPKSPQQSRSSQPIQGLPAQLTSLRPQPSHPPLPQPVLPSWPQANQPQQLRDRPRVAQRHDISFDNYSVRWLHVVLDGFSFTNIRLQNADNAQQGSHSPITVPPHQSESCNRSGVGGRGQKARRRSPQRRGTEEKALAVSFLSIRSISLRADYLCRNWSGMNLLIF